MTNFPNGITLRGLLENPKLLTTPKCKDTKNEADKKDKGVNAVDKADKMVESLEPTIIVPSAFLGPQVWDRIFPDDDSDFHLDYMELEEFLLENSFRVPLSDDQIPGRTVASLTAGSAVNHEIQRSDISSYRSVYLDEYLGEDEFDPQNRVFTDKELKTRPIVKKSKKKSVPNNTKDDKYWAWRKKNNIAAKISRDARRRKENHILLRTAFLEKQNKQLIEDLVRSQNEIAKLRQNL